MFDRTIVSDDGKYIIQIAERAGNQHQIMWSYNGEVGSRVIPTWVWARIFQDAIQLGMEVESERKDRTQ